MNRIYKIEFNTIDTESIYKQMSDLDKEWVFYMLINLVDKESIFDIKNNNNSIDYMIIEPIHMNRYIEILQNNFIKFNIIDISNDLVVNKMNIKKEINNHITESNKERMHSFLKKIDEWVYDNLNVDIILDRISKEGMESLTEIEKRFLNSV